MRPILNVYSMDSDITSTDAVCVLAGVSRLVSIADRDLENINGNPALFLERVAKDQLQKLVLRAGIKELRATVATDDGRAAIQLAALVLTRAVLEALDAEPMGVTHQST